MTDRRAVRIAIGTALALPALAILGEALAWFGVRSGDGRGRRHDGREPADVGFTAPSELTTPPVLYLKAR